MDVDKIGQGKQTFRIPDFWNYFMNVTDFGADYKNLYESRKIIKLKDHDIYFALVRVPFNDIEEFIIRIPTCDPDKVNWDEVMKVCEICRWRGPTLEPKMLW